MPAAPQAHNQLNGLDHLRALAIALVFVFHYSRIFPAPSWLVSAGKFGWTGVDLFFVLSGYLISSHLFAGIAAGKNVRFKQFFIKRFFRIIPPYLFIVAIYFCLPVVHEREALAPLWKYLSFTQNIGLDLRTQGTFSHAWSLCIEEQFYLLLPLTLIALLTLNKLKTGTRLLTILFITGLFYRYFAYTKMVLPVLDEQGGGTTWYKWVYYPTIARLDGLLTGVGIAALFQFKPNIAAKLTAKPVLSLLTGFCVLIAAYFICEEETSFIASVFGFPIISIGYGCLVITAISPKSFYINTGLRQQGNWPFFLTLFI